MKRLFALTIALFSGCSTFAQTREQVKFGNFETWVERSIRESAIIGGKIKKIYVPGPDMKIEGNKKFDYSNTIWTSSNAYAVVMGVTKVSCSVTPDKGPSGQCAKIESGYASVKVAGLVDINVFSNGSLFWGRTLEPISGVIKPYSYFDWGISFSDRPSALVLDYKSVIPNTGKIVKGGRTINGYDPEEIIFILQNRVEDKDGNIHVKRVGTAIYRINNSTNGWVKGFRIPVIYGDATKSSSYESYMGLKDYYYATNSKGENVPIVEEGWAAPGTPVTHAILSISSGSQNGLAGAVGNILWVDNIELEYE